MKFEKVTYITQEQFQMALEEQSRSATMLLLDFTLLQVYAIVAETGQPKCDVFEILSATVPSKHISQFESDIANCDILGALSFCKSFP
ncbi:hypothetical protein VNO77_39242 [Canavalia gladiata]|uniref:Uncharacterized protein n=1 Tax=Canavalia gladiata TaxID=3824 RepID=A0AAN9KE25_CANGL